MAEDKNCVHGDIDTATSSIIVLHVLTPTQHYQYFQQRSDRMCANLRTGYDGSHSSPQRCGYKAEEHTPGE